MLLTDASSGAAVLCAVLSNTRHGTRYYGRIGVHDRCAYSDARADVLRMFSTTLGESFVIFSHTTDTPL